MAPAVRLYELFHSLLLLLAVELRCYCLKDDSVDDVLFEHQKENSEKTRFACFLNRLIGDERWTTSCDQFFFVVRSSLCITQFDNRDVEKLLRLWAFKPGDDDDDECFRKCFGSSCVVSPSALRFLNRATNRTQSRPLSASDRRSEWIFNFCLNVIWPMAGRQLSTWVTQSPQIFRLLILFSLPRS